MTWNHDGTVERRTEVTKHHEAVVSIRLGDLKKSSKYHTKYHLLKENCHEYSKFLLGLATSDKKSWWDHFLLYLP